MQDNFFPPTHKRVGLNKSMFGAKFSKKNERAGSLFRVVRVDTKVPKCVGHLNDIKFIPVKTFVHA